MSNVVLVDLDDNVVGVEEKIFAHKNKLLHRAFSLFIYSGDKMLIQQRAYNKYHSGGKWANACCSHPVLGMSVEDCVIVRCKEELGVDVSRIRKLFDFVYYSEYDNGITEYELDNVYITEYDGAFDYDTNEINSLEWISLDVLKKQLVDNPAKFSTWFLIAAPKVIKYIESQVI